VFQNKVTNKIMKTLQFIAIAICLVPDWAAAQTISGKSNKVSVDYSPKPTPPVIVWMAPSQMLTNLDTKTMMVKVGINSTLKLQSATLLVNGAEPTNRRGLGASSPDASKFAKFIEQEVEFTNGSNEIKIVAVNEKGETSTESRTVNVTLPVALAASGRTDYALIIGSNDYDEWDDLVNPVFDATKIEEELKTSYGFKTELLLNPTKNEFVGKIREYIKKNYMDDDQLFIFVAGHGQFDEVFRAGYLVFKDTKVNDENKDSFLPHSTLRDYLETIPCKHVFLVMDACFGGTFDQVLAKRGTDDAVYQTESQDEFIQRKLQYKTRKYITSGGKVYVSDGLPNQHSPFAKLFMEALRSYGGPNGVLTIQEIWQYVEVAKNRPTTGEFGSNEPGSEFVFAAKPNR
jgi:Caspase domain